MALEFSAPWAPTGYGQQTALWVPRLAALGHEVAVSSFYGLQGGMIEWQGHKVYTRGMHPYGGDVVGLHARHFGADLVITLMDAWALPPQTLQGLNVAAWMPVDCEPLGKMDRDWLDLVRATPIAFSRFGKRQLETAGFHPMFVPHGIDTSIFIPPMDRPALRKAMGVEDKFVIFMNAANMDKQRKGFAEQFAAFAKFHAKHQDAMLVLHTADNTAAGLDLRAMAEAMGIAPQVKFSSQYMMSAGLIGPEQLRGSYGMADVFSGCSLAEGFGLPILEALSCGVPVVTTDGSAMREVGGPGAWLVAAEPTWAAGHNAWWQRPLIDRIVKAYEAAYQRGSSYQAKAKAARPHALTFDVEHVLKEFWVPALARLEAGLKR